MKKTIKTIYFFFGALMFLDVVIFLVTMIDAFESLQDGYRTDFKYTLILSLFPIICILLNILSIIRYRKKRPHVVVYNLLIKMPIFLELLSCPPLVLGEEVKPGQFYFWAISTFLLVICITVVFSGKKRKKTRLADYMKVPVNSELFSFFRPKETYKYAEKEYRRLNGISDSAKLSDSQLRDVSRYAVMPLAYLVKWAADNNKLSDKFRARHSTKSIMDLRNSKVSPPDYMLEEMQGCLDLSDFSSDSQIAMEVYLAPKLDNYSLSRINYFVDYYSFAHNDSGCFYCLDYSEEVYEKISTVILVMFFLSNYFTMNAFEYQAGYVMMNKQGRMGVNAFGDVQEEYMERCIAEVSCLSERVMDGMLQEIRINFYRELLRKLGPESENFPWSREKILGNIEFDVMTVLPPKEDELCYILFGKCTLIPRGGLSVMVRNGEVVYCGAINNTPWDRERKMPVSDFDPNQIFSPEQAMKYVEQGVLRESKPREIFADCGLESFFLPTEYCDEKERCDILLEGLRLRGLVDRETYEYERQPWGLIPDKLTITGWNKKKVVFQHQITIKRNTWE